MGASITGEGVKLEHLVVMRYLIADIATTKQSICTIIEQNSFEIDPVNRHDIPRHEIRKIICSVCDMEQDVQQDCIQCGIFMGKYFCSSCNFFDDDVSI
ncbi:E3 ubiquitin-protein ligase RZFP34 [Bienertia sinuspersici]